MINQTYHKYFPKSFSNNIIFFPINRINIPTLSIFHFQQKNLTLWKKTQLNVAKKKKTKGKKKEKILEAAQCPFNGLQRENPSCRNTRRLLYKLPLLEKFGRGGEVGTNGTTGCNLKKRTALRRFRKKGLVAYCLPLDCPLTVQSAFQRTTDRPLDT